MKAYGQFCSIAKALEIVGERWTLLVLRELICGSSRFTEIHRGIPRISPSLLSKRLTELETAGLVKKTGASGGYSLTSAGWELKPMVEALGIWGNRWVRGQLNEDDLDPDVLMWDVRRRINLENMPSTQICIHFEFTDTPAKQSGYWLVGSTQGVELCLTDPGFDVDLYVTTDVRTLTLVWNGDTALSARIEDGTVELHGGSDIRNAFPTWLQLGLFAGVEAAEKTSKSTSE
jgi:DNA-binding HxlR family transcriptional regulator